MAEYKSLGVAKARVSTEKLRQDHRRRLAMVVRAMRANGGFRESQDYRTAKNYAGTPITCEAYLDRLEKQHLKT